MRLFNKIASGVLAGLMLASSTAVFAQNEKTNLVFAGYDVNDLLNPYYIYNEVVNGVYANKQVYVRVDDADMKWIPAGFEAVYPYAGYSVLHIENPVTGEFEATAATAYNNLSPQWERRNQDYIIDFVDYKWWERQQTNIPGKGWTWDTANERFGITDDMLMRKTSRVADHTITWKDFGFAQYDNNFDILDYYTTIAEHHCDGCAIYTVDCDDCQKAYPIKYWNKADLEMYAIQKKFGALTPAVEGVLTGKEATFDVTAIPEIVSYVRASNQHVAKCPISVGCVHPEHNKGVTIAGELKARYDIEGWNEVLNYVLTTANVSARGNVFQNTAKYSRATYGNLLASEGRNVYYLTDDVIAEIMPVMQSKVITVANTTYDLVNEYIRIETAGIDFAKNPVAYYNALVDGFKWNWPSDLVRVAYNTQKIEWTALAYEMLPPHAYYQYMVVDGVAFNGANKLPTVVRYTGANASPVVEWKLAPVETWIVRAYEENNNLPIYATVEEMYVDGKLAKYNDGTVVTRVPAEVFAVTPYHWHIGNVALSFAHSYIEPAAGGRGNNYYITDNKGNDILVYSSVNYGTIGGASVNPNNDKLYWGDAAINAPVIAGAVFTK